MPTEASVSVSSSERTRLPNLPEFPGTDVCTQRQHLTLSARIRQGVGSITAVEPTPEPREAAPIGRRGRGRRRGMRNIVRKFLAPLAPVHPMIEGKDEHTDAAEDIEKIHGSYCLCFCPLLESAASSGSPPMTKIACVGRVVGNDHLCAGSALGKQRPDRFRFLRAFVPGPMFKMRLFRSRCKRSCPFIHPNGPAASIESRRQTRQRTAIDHRESCREVAHAEDSGRRRIPSLLKRPPDGTGRQQNPERLSMRERERHLHTRAANDPVKSLPGDLHLLRRFSMVQSLDVSQPQRLHLVSAHLDLLQLTEGNPRRFEIRRRRAMGDESRAAGTGHDSIRGLCPDRL